MAVRSSLPLSKARRLNSPGSAGLRPGRDHAIDHRPELGAVFGEEGHPDLVEPPCQLLLLFIVHLQLTGQFVSAALQQSTDHAVTEKMARLALDGGRRWCFTIVGRVWFLSGAAELGGAHHAGEREQKEKVSVIHEYAPVQGFVRVTELYGNSRPRWRKHLTIHAVIVGVAAV